MNSMTKPLDGKEHSVEQIVKYFETMYWMAFLKNTQLKKSDYYCGITNDVESNLGRHKIDGYTACVNCASKEIAGQVEAKLGEMGFDIGNPKNPVGNGGAENSTIVYMAYKESGFEK